MGFSHAFSRAKMAARWCEMAQKLRLGLEYRPLRRQQGGFCGYQIVPVCANGGGYILFNFIFFLRGTVVRGEIKYAALPCPLQSVSLAHTGWPPVHGWTSYTHSDDDVHLR